MAKQTSSTKKTTTRKAPVRKASAGEIIAVPRRINVKNKSVKSRVTSAAMNSVDPFSVGSGGASSHVTVNFASEQGRRGAEVLGLSSGPMATSIINSTIARRRSRHAVLTNGYAKRAVDIIVSNTVGQGHRMISLAPDKEFASQIEETWEEWTDEVDINGELNFGGFQALAFRSMIEGADCFIRLRNRRPEDGLIVPLQLQLFEGEQVPVTKNQTNGGNSIIGGIEFSPLGQVMAYHMHQNHPGDFIFNINQINKIAAPQETVRIPASEIIHMHDIRRPGEVRGLPILSAALIALSDLDRYLDAELVRKKAAALIGGFIRQPADMIGLNPFVTGDDDEGEEIHIEDMEPGTFPILPPGFEVTLSDPADVGSNFREFMKQQLFMISASLNVTYEQLTGDYVGSNDRTVRAAGLEFKRLVIQYQNTNMKHQFCRRVFQRWFRQALISGALTLPSGMTERQAMKVRWIADPWEFLNPLQEVNTHIAEVRGGFTSRSEIILSRGKIPEEVDRQIIQEREREKDNDLTYITNAGVVSNAGVVQSTDPSFILSDELMPPQQTTNQPPTEEDEDAP